MRFNKSFLLVLCILFAFSAVACQKSNSAKEQSAEQAERSAQEAEKMQAEAKAYNDAIKSEGELSPERAKELQERLKREHRMIPQRPVIKMSVESSNERISATDIERSYLYREGATKRCYLIALAVDPDAKGELSLELARTENDNETVVRGYETTGKLDDEEFKSCIVAMAKRWPLPTGAELKVKFDLDALPAPTVEELRRENAKYEYRIQKDHDHDHDHDHGDGPSFPRIPQELLDDPDVQDGATPDAALAQ